MANLEDALVDRCLKRARDYGGVPFTKQRLASRCFSDISMHGPEANTSVRLKGTRGLGLKKQRRLFPSGPLGVIRFAEPGVLEVEFPSVELLTALDGRHTARGALAAFFTGPSKAFPEKMPLALALQFAQQNLRVDLDPEVVELVYQNSAAKPIGNSRLLIQELLEIEDVAVARRWKTLDMGKWRAAGLTWPLIRPLRARSLPPKTSGRMYLVCERHAKLLRHFDQADDAGKLFIEQSAFLAAAPRPQPAPQQ
ncbi:hypothetical protein [Delftia sp. JD2]|uniref:hypothetical protein n=1 Tax=Delftia sp. JD2 TaxID=469553 RepID=UPI001111BC81|nr:hypothetical protein [Delftia sp. JD2]